METKISHSLVGRQSPKIFIALAVILLLSIPLIALGDATPHSTNSMMAESPINSYTAGIMLYMLLVGFLVTFLLGGAFAILNIGLFSKREQDSSLGHADPSDLLFMKENHVQHILPAEEGEIENPITQLANRQHWSEGATLVTEEQMFHEGSGESKAA